MEIKFLAPHAIDATLTPYPRLLDGVIPHRFRERDWALDAHKTVSYDDHDRAALMGVLRRRDTGERLVFVSTHLARNPESLKQQGVRLRQVAQLMRELHTFYKEQGIDLCGNQPVCRVRPTILH